MESRPLDIDARRRALTRLAHEVKAQKAFGLEALLSPKPSTTLLRSVTSRSAVFADNPPPVTGTEEDQPVPRKSVTGPVAEPTAQPAAPAAIASQPSASPPQGRPLTPKEAAQATAALTAQVASCTRCKLHKGRTKTVFGEGPLGAELMFIGEGPGADEDATGRPFVGRAGQLLTKIIEAMGRRREDMYIANVVKCRPPQNRTPEPDEIGACLPYLQQQIQLVQPKIICTLGAPATKTLLGITTPMGQARGKVYKFGAIRVVPTFHPAYLLRNPAEKRKVWEDVQLVNRLLAGGSG